MTRLKGSTDIEIIKNIITSVREEPEHIVSLAKRANVHPSAVKKWAEIIMLVQSAPKIHIRDLAVDMYIDSDSVPKKLHRYAVWCGEFDFDKFYLADKIVEENNQNGDSELRKSRLTPPE